MTYRAGSAGWCRRSTAKLPIGRQPPNSGPPGASGHGAGVSRATEPAAQLPATGVGRRDLFGSVGLPGCPPAGSTGYASPDRREVPARAEVPAGAGTSSQDWNRSALARRAPRLEKPCKSTIRQSPRFRFSFRTRTPVHRCSAPTSGGNWSGKTSRCLRSGSQPSPGPRFGTCFVMALARAMSAASSSASTATLAITLEARKWGSRDEGSDHIVAPICQGTNSLSP
jgi:hypothetical protein